MQLKTFAFVILATLGNACMGERPSPIVEDGRPRCTVIVSADASLSEKWAAEELVLHVEQMSGAKLDVQFEPTTAPENAIFIGDGKAVRSLGVKVDVEDLGAEGFMIKTIGNQLIIAGGRQRGTMYGVFTLLEKLGCRWWYPGASTIPERKTITLPVLDERQVPALEYRDFLYGEMDSSEEAMVWRARNKVNGGFYKDMKSEYGGAYKFHTLVHSYDQLMPPSKYFGTEPTRYALRHGKRNAGQPCFSDPAAVRTMAESILRLIDEHPDWGFFTVGQNDNSNYCQCDGCNALAERHESHGGSQVHFAQEIGKIVWKKHPDVILNVPAYRWTRKPPKNIDLDPRMAITLCSIECNFGQPLAEGYPDENAAFKADIEGWSKIAPRLFIWDYTTNFTHYLLPYPNYYVLAPNVKFYADHKARGIMHQGSHTTRHAQLAPLSMWVLAKAMWEPNLDGRRLVQEFCFGYHGPEAGKCILQYVEMLHNAIVKDRTPIWCTQWHTPGTFLSASYLSPDLVARAEQLFQQAEAAVANDAELLRRVQIDHLPVQNVVLRRTRQMRGPAKRLCPDLDWAEYTAQFGRVGRAARVGAMREGDHAEELFQWAVDYGKLTSDDPTRDLLDELRAVAPKAYHFLQAAQLDGQVRFLREVDGATDGWAQAVISPGWSIQHNFGHPWDFQVGKQYRMFVRAKASATGQGDATAISVGIHVRDGSRTCARDIKVGDVDGTWQVFDIGPWTPTEAGGMFYIARGRSGVKDVFLDCVWLVETTAQ